MTGRISAMEIRRVDEADWQLVRDLRLQALVDTPQAFASTYEREAAFADQVWMERTAARSNATFVCEADGVGCGMVTLVRDHTDAQQGWLVGMWVAPAARGSGAADQLVAPLLLWAHEQRLGTVRLHVAEGNGRAERLYLRHGFTRTGGSFVNERTGLVEVEMARASPPAGRTE